MPTATRSPDLDISHLLPHQQVIAKAVLRALPKDATGGGCRAFYTPKEWAERREEFGRESLLILCHDGGSLAPACNWAYENLAARERLRRSLEKIGLYVEQCTSWYSAVYVI